MRQAAAIVREGGVIAYPTDSCYALGCHIGDKACMERMRDIRGVDERHHFTLMCRDLAQAAVYARIDDRHFGLVKSASGGAYTFILQATREVPRRLLHPKRKTIGIRISPHPVVHALLAELDEPLLSTTLALPEDDDHLPLNDAHEIRARLEHRLELVLDGGACGIVPTTVLDCTGEVPRVVRAGGGSVEALGVAVGS